MSRPARWATSGAALTWVGVVVAVCLHLHNGAGGGDLTTWWLANALTAAMLVTPGWLIATRRPGNAVGWLLVVAGLAQALTALGREYAVLGLVGDVAVPLPVLALSVSESLWLVTGTALILLLLLFPDGRPLSRRWAPVSVVLLVAAAVFDGVGILSPGVLTLGDGTTVSNPIGLHSTLLDLTGMLAALVLVATALLACAGVLLRFRRSRGDERLQMMWFVAGGIVAVTELLGEFVLPDSVSILLSPVAAGLFAAAIAVAVLRYRLYDIDLVINRTLVYVALTTSLVAAYLVVVTALGTQLGRRIPVEVSLLAAALVAVALAPLRSRLQGGVDRLMYGDRADPYGVLTRLTGSADTSASPAETLALFCRTVAESLRLPYVAVVREVDGNEQLLAAYGELGTESQHLAMSYQGEHLGHLLVTPRPGGDLRHPLDRRLLADLAAHAGVVVYAALVSEDLRRSRQRVIEAREEERQRLHRDLHDGLGPTLAAVRMSADAARALLRKDPDRAEEMLVALRADAVDAVASVRRLVYELRPPSLDELGLVTAIREQAERLGRSGCLIRVLAPDPMPGLAAAVEVAAYRILTEAMTNVARHAEARECTVSVTVNGRVELAVEDDGRGLPATMRPGVGIVSMRERAGELGGSCEVQVVRPHGTRVTAVLPLGGTA